MPPLIGRTKVYVIADTISLYDEFKDFLRFEYDGLTVQMALEGFMKYALNPSTPKKDLLAILSLADTTTSNNKKRSRRKNIIENTIRLLKSNPEGMFIVDMVQVFEKEGLDILNSHINNIARIHSDDIELSWRQGKNIFGKTRRMRFIKLKNKGNAKCQVGE